VVALAVAAATATAAAVKSIVPSRYGPQGTERHTRPQRLYCKTQLFAVHCRTMLAVGSVAVCKVRLRQRREGDGLSIASMASGGCCCWCCYSCCCHPLSSSLLQLFVPFFFQRFFSFYFQWGRVTHPNGVPLLALAYNLHVVVFWHRL
jgi:hypothetical protein